MRTPDNATTPKTLPASFIAAAARIGCQIDPQTTCAPLAIDGMDACCFVALSPSLRNGQPCIVIAILGGSQSEREQFTRSLARLVNSSEMKLPRVTASRIEGAIILIAPWTFRAGESGWKAFLRQVTGRVSIAQWHMPTSTSAI